MSGEIERGDEEHEPELRAGERPPVKKPMVVFLAEFEERLKSHPDEPATGALRLVEQRAGGLRRSPEEAAPSASADATSDSAGAVEDAPDAPQAAAADVVEETADNAPDARPPETAAATPGELRRLRGRRRRKHRHRAH